MKFTISNSSSFGQYCNDCKLTPQQRRLHKNLLDQHIQANGFTLDYCDEDDDSQDVDYIYEDKEDTIAVQQETNIKSHKLNSLTVPLTGVYKLKGLFSSKQLKF
jgi:hypothetical protein